MKIKLPKTIKELRQYHLEAIAEIDVNNMELYDKVVLVHKLTGLEVETVKRISIQQINEIIEHYTNLIAQHKRSDPQKEIEVNGKKYSRVESLGKMPMSWHIDMNVQGVKDASVVASFIYIEKGLSYCQMDEHKNIINPLAGRIELFREYLDAGTHIDIGFFLSEKSDKYVTAYEEIQRQRRIKSERKKERGRKRRKRQKN